MSEEDSPRSATPAVFLSVFGLAAIAGVVAMPFLAGDPSPEALSQWGKFLGRFHPLALHLPIGMLTLVLLLEIGKLFKSDKGASTLVPVFFAAVSSIVAVIFGFLLYQSGGYEGETIENHLWWGTGFTVALIACTVMKAWVDRAGGRGNWVYVVSLFVSGGIMGVASHDGGSITHGSDYLTAEAPNEVREVLNNFYPEGEKLPLLVEAGESVGIPLEEQVVLTHLVQPIFDQKCVSCHGPDKQKGKLRMDTYELTLEGGKEGEGIEPGDAEGSNIMFRVHLPEDDEEHMPPENKKQLDAHEIAVIEWWIDSGASPDLKVVDAEIPEEIQEAISQLVPPEVVAAEAAAAEEAVAEESASRDALADQVKALQEVFPSALNFESQQTSGVTFSAVSMRKTFGDEQLAKLAELAPALVSVDLSATSVTDDGLKALKDASTLRMLRLSETAVTDAGIDAISGMAALESLNLYGTQVTKDGVMKLADLPNLKRLYLWQTGVDAAAADELRKTMPECEIVLGIESDKE